MLSTLNSNNPRWRDLTPVQKRLISNGCGAKGGWFKPPSFIFKASCNQHDFYYWRGATKADRKEADKAFLRAMLADAKDSAWWARGPHRLLANIYYLAVRTFGEKAFTYREAPATWEDLDKAINSGL